MKGQVSVRVFKTFWFAKAAKKTHIADTELCEAIQQVMLGQAEDLGGGVFKKRLNSNMHRSIILAKGGRIWVYQYLFSKQDRKNIDEDELVQFRSLARIYEQVTASQIAALVAKRNLLEICNGH
jgi:hypothetical protein